MANYQEIRSELQRELRTLLGDHVYFSANAPAPRDWHKLPRIQELLHALISALQTHLQLQAVGTEAQGYRAAAERLRRQAAALGELRFAWHDAATQQQLWRLVWDTASTPFTNPMPPVVVR